MFSSNRTHNKTGALAPPRCVCVWGGEGGGALLLGALLLLLSYVFFYHKKKQLLYAGWS